jgi:hypothetical protein
MDAAMFNIQSDFFAWARLQSRSYPELALMFSIPNGMKQGVSWIFLPCARGGSHGLFIDLRNEDDRGSGDETRVRESLREEGYSVIVCFSIESAITLTTWYLMDHPISDEGW